MEASRRARLLALNMCLEMHAKGVVSTEDLPSLEGLQTLVQGLQNVVPISQDARDTLIRTARPLMKHMNIQTPCKEEIAVVRGLVTWILTVPAQESIGEFLDTIRVGAFADCTTCNSFQSRLSAFMDRQALQPREKRSTREPNRFTEAPPEPKRYREVKKTPAPPSPPPPSKTEAPPAPPAASSLKPSVPNDVQVAPVMESVPKSQFMISPRAVPIVAESVVDSRKAEFERRIQAMREDDLKREMMRMDSIVMQRMNLTRWHVPPEIQYEIHHTRRVSMLCGNFIVSRFRQMCMYKQSMVGTLPSLLEFQMRHVRMGSPVDVPQSAYVANFPVACAMCCFVIEKGEACEHAFGCRSHLLHAACMATFVATHVDFNKCPGEASLFSKCVFSL